MSADQEVVGKPRPVFLWGGGGVREKKDDHDLVEKTGR